MGEEILDDELEKLFSALAGDSADNVPPPPGFELGPLTDRFYGECKDKSSSSTARPAEETSGWQQQDSPWNAEGGGSHGWSGVDWKQNGDDQQDCWSNGKQGAACSKGQWSNGNSWNSKDNTNGNEAESAANGAIVLAPQDNSGVHAGQIVINQEDLIETYYAAKTWDDLNLPKPLLDGIQDMGFSRPAKIQEWALPIAVKGGNIIAQAQNGSGKTAAFAISLLMRVDRQYDCTSGLVICPTRELALQNAAVIEKLGQFYDVKIFLAVPQDTRAPKSVDAHIVVGTPGKMDDLMRKRAINAQWIQILVLDEADVMISEDMQLGSQVHSIRKKLPEELQVLLFSATWPENVERFAKAMTNGHATRIEVKKEDLTLATITQTYMEIASDAEKYEKLRLLYGAVEAAQGIIFVNTRKKAFELATSMKAEGYTVSLICGTQQSGPDQIDVATRDRIMHEFRQGITRCLIATDVLSRGIDVPAVTLVVNYDLPKAHGERDKVDMETYMHRIGRTGRFGLRGLAVSLVTQWDAWQLDEIKKFYNCNIAKISGDLGFEELTEALQKLR